MDNGIKIGLFASGTALGLGVLAGVLPVIAPNLAHWIAWFGAGLAVVSAVPLIYFIGRARSSPEQSRAAGTVISSVNQSGGITAQNVTGDTSGGRER